MKPEKLIPDGVAIVFHCLCDVKKPSHSFLLRLEPYSALGTSLLPYQKLVKFFATWSNIPSFISHSYQLTYLF
jgi:hypothetical protein